MLRPLMAQAWALQRMDAGDVLARQGQIDEAIALFAQAMENDPTLAIEPPIRAGQLYASTLAAEGRRLAFLGDVDKAIALFTQAMENDPTLAIDPRTEAKRIAAEILPIMLGETVTGVVSSNATTRWSLTLDAITAVTVDIDLPADNSDLIAQLSIYAAAGNLIAEHGGLLGLGYRMPTITLDPGRYLIDIKALAGTFGAYRLSVVGK